LNRGATKRGGSMQRQKLDFGPLKDPRKIKKFCANGIGKPSAVVRVRHKVQREGKRRRIARIAKNL